MKKVSLVCLSTIGTQVKLVSCISLVCIVSLLCSCSEKNGDKGEIPSVDVRELLQDKGVMQNVFAADEIETVEYIPLEITQNDASLIAGILDFTVSNDFIYVLPIKENKIMQFDKKGHFIKNVVTYGQGPGEYNGFPQNIYVDDASDRLYIANMDKTWEYTLSGEFVAVRQRANMVSYEYKVAPDRYAAVSYLGVPFQIPGVFGIGVFSEQEDTIAMKKDFLSPENVPEEVSGFTNVAVAWNQNSVLFKTASNDTVFRLTKDGIAPAYILNLKNSVQEIVRGLKVRNSDGAAPDDIWVWDMLETPSHFYYRFMLDNNFYIGALNRLTGKASLEHCSTPTDDIYQLVQLNRLLALTGMKSFKTNAPFWGSCFKDELVQIITAPEWVFFKEKGLVQGLDGITEDDNPIVVIAKLNPRYVMDTHRNLQN